MLGCCWERQNFVGEVAWGCTARSTTPGSQRAVGAPAPVKDVGWVSKRALLCVSAVSQPLATKAILAEYEPGFILDEPIPEDVERHLPWSIQPQRPFIDLDDLVPFLVQPPADEWVEILNDAKDEFEVDGTAAVSST